MRNAHISEMRSKVMLHRIIAKDNS
jgi:hypothetical protein